MPAFNAARTIGSSIRSVLNQTEQDFEVVVVDDGSTDDTPERAQSFASDPRVRVIAQRNRGPSAARNAGLASARGLYVSMLDADDLWLPEYLEVMGGALDANPDAAFAYTDAWVLDDQTGRIRRKPAMFYQRPPRTVPDARTFFLLLLDRKLRVHLRNGPPIRSRRGGRLRRGSLNGGRLGSLAAHRRPWDATREASRRTCDPSGTSFFIGKRTRER